MISEMKTLLRKQISEEIIALPDDYIAESNRGLFLRVVSLEVFNAARNIMMYYSVKREPATLEIAEAVLSMGKTVAFPHCYRGGIMQARVVSSLNELYPAMLGIPAPPDTAPVISREALDLILVPALAYDSQGQRLGYGGGDYDRYLSGIPAFTLGLARERLMKDKLPAEPHDIAVQCIVTEECAFCPTVPMK